MLTYITSLSDILFDKITKYDINNQNTVEQNKNTS